MRDGWDVRASFSRATAALVVLTLVPVAALVGSAPSHTSAVPPLLLPGGAEHQTVGAQDYTEPVAEALRRGQQSDLFASFLWDNQSVEGPFVRFDYAWQQGLLSRYSAVNGTQVLPYIDQVAISPFQPVGVPVVAGPTFMAAGDTVTITAHDDPMGLLEIRTLGGPHTIVFQFLDPGTTILDTSYAFSWPHAALSFAIGGTRGRLIVGSGTLEVNRTMVVAKMADHDYLAVKAVPEFAAHRAERSAMLDAFASGRLAAEFAFVAIPEGGWVESSANFRATLQSTSQGVETSRAIVQLGARESQSGLVILAFDAATMPVDATHRLVVTINGTEIPETADPLGGLYAMPSTAGQAFFTPLAMNATMLVVYVPDLRATPLEVESVALTTPAIDWATQLAMVAGLLVVSVAAAVMFRRHPE